MKLFHIADSEIWKKAQQDGLYYPPSFKEEGFIHCSLAHQVQAVANRLFQGKAEITLLEINESELTVPVKCENLDGDADLYPHIYGGLPLTAVQGAIQLFAQENGEFIIDVLLPKESSPEQEIAFPCHCHSEIPFKNCCQPHIDFDVAVRDPETLLRSRYSAFRLGRIDYLRKTWHPETLPELDGSEPSNWISLEVIESGVDASDTEGEAEFIAKLIVDDCLETLHEISEFCKVEGKWVYHSGEFLNENQKPQKISMKSPCPCGSKKAFKFCHYCRDN